MSFSIRFAAPEDTGVLLSLIHEMAAYEELSHEVTATEEILKKSLFEEHCAEALLAEEDGEIAGYALIYHNFSTFTGKKGIYLEDIYIKPVFRNKGYGKKLFIRIAQLSLERDCGRMEWACLDWNTPSINFYHKMGATQMGEWSVFRMTESKLRKLKAMATDAKDSTDE